MILRIPLKVKYSLGSIQKIKGSVHKKHYLLALGIYATLPLRLLYHKNGTMSRGYEKLFLVRSSTEVVYRYFVELSESFVA